MSGPPGVRSKKNFIISNAGSAGGGKNRNLSNNDFRSLLNTPRPNRGDVEQEELKQQERALKKQEKKHKSYQRWQERKAQLAAKAQIKYRDRAAERRVDANPDYEGKEQYEEVEVEKNKYLGGDEEHTHLVKGLDRALLEKTRSEVDRKEEEHLEEEYQKTHMEDAKEEAKPKIHKPKFNSHLARKIYDLTVGAEKKKSKPVSNFLPGRMVFEFERDLHFSSDLPTTLMLPRSELPGRKKEVAGTVPGNVRQSVSKLMEMLASGSKHKGSRKRRKHEAEPEEKNKPKQPELKPKPPLIIQDEPDDDDIFAGVGSGYVPEGAEAQPSSSSSNSTYFTSAKDSKYEEDMINKELDQLPKQDDEEEEKQKVAEAVARARLEQELQQASKNSQRKKEKKEDPSFVGDVYTELPGGLGGAGSSMYVVEESDEGDPMEDYKKQKEATKAASQSESKMKRGRNQNNDKMSWEREKTKTRKQKQHSKDQKFEAQFKKLQSHMGKRKDPREEARAKKRSKILIKK